MNVKKPCKLIKRQALLSVLFFVVLSLAALQFFSACSSSLPERSALPKVLAVESFLADITKNISADRLQIETLMPIGIDPHSFEPSYRDVAKISESDILIINGSGFEDWLNDTITGANKKIIIVECSKGLANRIGAAESDELKDESAQAVQADEPKEASEQTEKGGQAKQADTSGAPASENDAIHKHEGDPHFWLDPNLVKIYVQNIKDALTEADPEGRQLYDKNAREYTSRLTELDVWIKEEVKKIPVGERLLVTNHESFGYYADRYGFIVIGTIIPGSSSASSPSAMEVAELIKKIKATGAKAIFLETGSDPKIADQIAKETGIKIVTELFTHSLTEAGGLAPTYIEMIKFNTKTIVESLK